VVFSNIFLPKLKVVGAGPAKKEGVVANLKNQYKMLFTQWHPPIVSTIF
jgi:hypothetical protein